MSGQREYTTAADAKAHAAAVAEECRRHRITCSACRRSRGQGHGHCDAGWEMAKTIARAASEIRRLSAPAEADQGTLF